jgi:membrane protein DedA with SNARE-associated domain
MCGQAGPAGNDALGELGVGLFTLAETIAPPIPSEVILPLAGFCAKQGALNLVLVFVAGRRSSPGRFTCQGLSQSAAWA